MISQNQVAEPKSKVEVDWVTTIFLIGTPIAAALLIPGHAEARGFGLKEILFFVFYSYITGMSITAGYHRYLSHQSYEPKNWVKILYLLFGAATFQGSALKWCSDHRRHHRFVDTQDDPYSIKRGFFFAHIGWLFVKDDPKYRGKFAPDLAKDPLIYFQHKYYVPVSIIMGFGVPTLTGWLFGDAMSGFIYGGVLRVVFVHHCTFFINSLCHMLGSQPYTDKNSARDSFVMAFLTYGEGYHNFHHIFQADYRNGIRWYHWDPTKWAIQLLALFGQAKGLKQVSNFEILKARMKNDEKRLRNFGVPQERIDALKIKVEETQKKWNALKEEYALFKQSMRDQSQEKILALKSEVSYAKREFDLYLSQWRAYASRPQLLALQKSR